MCPAHTTETEERLAQWRRAHRLAPNVMMTGATQWNNFHAGGEV
jgi:hypothetical protein